MAQIGKYLEALGSKENKIFRECRLCPVMVNNSCLEDESEVALVRDEEEEDGVGFWVDFVFQPNNLTLSTTIEAGGEVKKCPNQELEKKRRKRTVSSSWPAVAGVFLAACLSLVGCCAVCLYSYQHG